MSGSASVGVEIHPRSIYCRRIPAVRSHRQLPVLAFPPPLIFGVARAAGDNSEDAEQGVADQPAIAFQFHSWAFLSLPVAALVSFVCE
jgi:hypothetical protein